MKVALLALLVALGLGCGGGGTAIDAGIDASAIDTLAPDAVDRCQDLCACSMEFCADDMAACVAQCAGLDDSVLLCRIQHCAYAQTNPGYHCPHALGDAQSTGIPPACIQN